MAHLLNPQTLAQLSAIGAEALGEIVASYAKDAKRRLGALASLVAAQEAEPVMDLLHTLKGASLTLGAERVANRCSEGERAAENGDWDAVGREFQGQLNEEVRSAIAALSAQVGS